MSLRGELQLQLLAFAEGTVEERALFAWLGSVGRHIEHEDLETRQIWKTAFSLLSEVAGHVHDVGTVQREITNLLRMAGGQHTQVQDPAASRFADEIIDQIRCYVDGVTTAEELSGWLDAHAQEIHDSGSLELRGLADLTFSALEERLQGVRTDESTRGALSKAVPAEHEITSRVS